MATFRVGVGSFNINDGSVGIGTEGSGHGNLKIEGTVKSTSLDALGVSTFTRYSGFNADEVKVSNRDLTLSGEYSTTGDVVVEDGASLTVGLGSTACVGTVESLSIRNHFSVPSGNTAQRNESAGYGEGTIRYNSDLGTMEFFNGDEWKQFTYISDAQYSSSGRAVYGGGNNSPTPYAADIFTAININTLGNSSYFGDSLHSNWALAGGGCDGRRGIFAGGLPNASHFNTIEYVTVASTGNGIDFGDLSNSQGRDSGGAATTSTRMCITGSLFRTPGNTKSNIIDYVETQTLGNAKDFGDMVINMCNGNGFSSTIRGFFFGTGFDNPSIPIIHFINIASKGDSKDFGDSTSIRQYPGGGSSPVRGVISGGNTPTSTIRTIDYVTMSSSGNATHFGDLTVARHSPAGASSKTRTVFAGGYTDQSDSNTDVNNMDYITIASAGNATDFGDLIMPTSFLCSASSCHGGLGGS
jgi:hypothetical protein